MQSWTGKITIIALFVLVVSIPVVFRPTEVKIDDDALKLVIVTPHNEQICYETEKAFNEYYEKKFGRTVIIDWRLPGGTSDIERSLKSQYTNLAKDGLENEGIGIDLIFGGGNYMYNYVLKPGVTVGNGGETRHVSITVPIGDELGDEFIDEIYGDGVIADRRLYDSDGHWWGVVLSSFGIVYNRDVLAMLNMDEPATWSDLADEQYFGWIALADPSHSGSVRVTYESILQRYGFERGLHTLRRVFANARYFSPSSSRVPVDVSAGNAAAGMCIDFYGRYQSQMVGGGTRVGFIAPANATLVSADPIAVLRGAPHRELAIRFVRFLLTQRGQGIWNFHKGDEFGPKRFELRRLPIRHDMYEKYFDRMIDKVNPYDIAKALDDDVPSYFSVVPTLMHSMMMDVHDDLKAAWLTIIKTDDDHLRKQMLIEFDKLPEFETTDGTRVFTSKGINLARKRWKKIPHAADEDRLKWTKFFREQYLKIAAMGENNK